MAYAYKKPSVVSGLSIDDIMNLDPNYLKNLSFKEQKLITSRLVSAANKRQRRLKNANLENFSVKGRKQNSPFSIKGATDSKELMKIYNQTRSYLRDKTTTVKEARAIKQRSVKKLTDFNKYKSMSLDQKAQIEKVVANADEISRKIINKIYDLVDITSRDEYYELREHFAKMVYSELTNDSGTFDDIDEYVDSNLEKFYSEAVNSGLAIPKYDPEEMFEL